MRSDSVQCFELELAFSNSRATKKEDFNTMNSENPKNSDAKENNTITIKDLDVFELREPEMRFETEPVSTVYTDSLGNKVYHTDPEGKILFCKKFNGKTIDYFRDFPAQDHSQDRSQDPTPFSDQGPNHDSDSDSDSRPGDKSAPEKSTSHNLYLLVDNNYFSQTVLIPQTPESNILFFPDSYSQKPQTDKIQTKIREALLYVKKLFIEISTFLFVVLLIVMMTFLALMITSKFHRQVGKVMSLVPSVEANSAR